ncbi:MAG: hypothetical protein QM750_01260 [Rubrivivax sp.]
MGDPQNQAPDLVYNIAEGRLNGEIDGVVIAAYAGSGGRANSKTRGAVNDWLANNPFAVGVKKTASNPGGPLPMGRYYVVSHEAHKNWLRLVPVRQAAMHGRSGMAIHGRGPRGSDGCIVPTDFAVVLRLCELVKAREDAGGDKVVLEVVAIGDLDRWLNRA